MKPLFSLLMGFGLAAASLPLTSVAQQPAQPARATFKPVDPSVIKELQGHWHNDFDDPSTLFIESIDSATGQIKGTYKSPNGAGAAEYPLIGWVNVTQSPDPSKTDHVIVVAFSANFKENGSVSAWNGYYYLKSGKPTIIGQWFLSRTSSKYSFEHILSNQDQYHKIKDN